MKLLLDTHIWLWSLLEPMRLSPQVGAALTADDAERWLSPLSIWEALLLIERKSPDVDRAGEAWIREALERAHYRSAGPPTFDAGPVFALPHKLCSGTHAWWTNQPRRSSAR